MAPYKTIDFSRRFRPTAASALWRIGWLVCNWRGGGDGGAKTRIGLQPAWIGDLDGGWSEMPVDIGLRGSCKKRA